jgi:hypothetical protein
MLETERETGTPYQMETTWDTVLVAREAHSTLIMVAGVRFGLSTNGG